MVFGNIIGATGSTTCAATNQIWGGWISQTGTTSCTNDIWQGWINVTSTTTNTATTWISWVNSAIGVQYANQLAQYQLPQQPPAQQMQGAQIAAAEERRKQVAEEEKKRKVAHARSMELLRANLSQKQRATLDKNKWFVVEGGKSKKTYRISATDRYAGNIHELDDKGVEVARYCVHASYEIPLGDQWLTQALSLRLDEEHLIKTANKTVLRAA